MSYYRGVRVFNQFTFFSVLIPGLFAIAFALPVAPASVFRLDAGWVLVLVVGLSFGVGMTLHIASESFEQWLPWADRPTERMTARLNELAGDGEVDGRMLIEFLEGYDARFNARLSAKVAADDEAEKPFDNTAGERVFQATLTELWSKNVGPIRILVTTYFLCRSMALLIPVLAVTYLGFAGLLFADAVRFVPAYVGLLTSRVFAGLVLIVFGSGFFVFLYGYNRYAQYTIDYLIAGFVQIRELETDDPAADG